MREPSRPRPSRPRCVVVALLVGAAAAGACALDGPPREGPAPSADAFVRSGLLPIGDTRERIGARLGEPARVTSETVPNRHVPGVTDTLIVLEYPGLAVHVHRPGMADAGDLISRVDVTDDRYLRFSVPTIGTDLAELERVLGPPSEVDGEGFTYACPSCVVDMPVKFLVRENRVREIRFHYYVD